jgi:hypothetical protein
MQRRNTSRGGSSRGHARSNQGAKLSFSYDASVDILTVEGVRYKGDVFRKLAEPEDGYFYQLRQKTNGVVVIERMEPTLEAEMNKAFDDEVGDGAG